MRYQSLLLLSILLLSVGIQGIEAIVKQQARSDDSQQQQPPSPGGNGPSSGNGSGNNGPISYSPGQSSGGPPSSSSHQPSGSARSQAGPSSSSSAATAGSVSSPSSQQDSMMSGYMSSPKQGSSNNNAYQNYSPNADQMLAAASSPDQSYQAAAQSVNMALANSGIFGPSSGSSSSSAPSPTQTQAQQQQTQQQNYNQQGNPSGGAGLNPLHYFYYPSAKEASAPSQSGAQMKPLDLMNAASSNQYSSIPAGSYVDQLGQAQSGQMQPFGQAGSPDMAASSQDPSYLPQPQSQLDQQQQPSQQAQAQQQAQPQQQQPSSQNQLFMQNQNQYNSNTQSSNNNQLQDNYNAHSSAGSSSISFNGPSSGSPQDNFMNSPLNGHQQQQSAQFGGQNQNQNNFFSQLNGGGDLSTSNFGSIPSNGLGSIASYMAPPQASQQQPQPHDSLFGQSLSSSPFNSAASQLSPAVAPPSPQQQQQQQQQHQSSGSSLFSSGSSLFGAQQPQQQQQPSSAGSNFFSNQHYLNSFLTPQQYTQLTGQQIGELQGQSQQLFGNQQQGLASSGSSPIASVASNQAPQASSSKRFGFSSLVMPVLALAGLSLLIPTLSTLNGPAGLVGRKKRSIVEEKASVSSRQQQLVSEPMNGAAHQLAKESMIGEYLDRIQRYYSIYQNAVENDDCMNRLICEFGDAVKDVTGNGAVIHVVESLAPGWMKVGGNRMQIFKEAAAGSGGPKEKCKKYTCQKGGATASRQH